MWRKRKKEKCDHVWKLRLDNARVEHKKAEYSGTRLLYICTKCATWKVDWEIFVLKEEDFIGTPLGEMIQRYKDNVKEARNATTPTNGDNTDSNENR